MKPHPSSAPPTVRRLLLITYYFPPSGGPGVQRALKFARYLPAFGWEPTVLTVRPESAAYPDLDPTLSREIPPDLRLERTRAWDPYALYARLQGKPKGETVGVGFLGEAEMSRTQRLARWLRANVFLPDARVGWVPFAIHRGRALIEGGGYDAVVTTGPPHSAHLAGWALSERYGLPWLADFRDPWTDISYYRDLPMTAPARRLDARLERAVLEAADEVVAVSPSLQARLRQKASTDVRLLPNGFDEADFEGVDVRRDAAFVLTYTGNLPAQQDPAALWAALRRLRDEEAVPELKLRLVGNVDPVVLASIRQAGWGDRLERIPYVPHAEAIKYMRRGALLLLCINRVEGAESIVTGKLYEYLASSRPVLAVGPVGGDAAAVLAETSAGRMFDYDDADGVAAFIRRHYAAWEEGSPEAGADEGAARRYSRRQQAGRLAELLDGLTQTDAAPTTPAPDVRLSR